MMPDNGPGAQADRPVATRHRRLRAAARPRELPEADENGRTCASNRRWRHGRAASGFIEVAVVAARHTPRTAVRDGQMLAALQLPADDCRATRLATCVATVARWARYGRSRTAAIGHPISRARLG